MKGELRMDSLMHAYDMATDNEEGHGWIEFCGAYLGVSSEGDGLIYVWDTRSPQDTDEMYDAFDLEPDEFMTEVEEWVHDEISEELIEA